MRDGHVEPYHIAGPHCFASCIPHFFIRIEQKTLVVAIEAAYFRYGFKRRRALFWSLVANGASLGLGLLLRPSSDTSLAGMALSLPP